MKRKQRLVPLWFWFAVVGLALLGSFCGSTAAMSNVEITCECPPSQM